MANNLLNSPAQIASQVLRDLGIGGDPTILPLPAWPVYTSNEPDSPDNVITVYDTTGQNDGRSMFGPLWQHYGLQIRVRGIDHPTGWLQADAIRKAISEQVYAENTTVGGNPYTVHCFAGIGTPIAVGKDIARGSKRSIFTINCFLVIDQ